MKLKQIFISLATLAAFLYLGLSDVSRNISSDISKDRPVNASSRKIEQMEYKNIDGICYLIIYEADGTINVYPVSKDFCD